MKVAITTSDGFSASGSALDATLAAGDYALLDEFTRFLERRVFSVNLWLLRRVLAEYFCHCESTLQQFIAQGSTQIAVGPVALASALTLQEAQRMLAKRRASPADSGRSSSAFTYLVTRVCTKKLALLMSFFVEFCDGREDSLCEFTETGDGFVAILPSPLPLTSQPYQSADGIAFTSDEPLAMPPPPTRGDSVTPTHQVRKHRKHDKIQPTEKAVASSATPTTATSTNLVTEFTDEEIAFVASTGPASHSNPLIVEVKRYLIMEVEKIEAQQPWCKLYNATEPPLPFDEANHPQLAKQMRAFWIRYGHAVWERSFWAPQCESIDAIVAARRKARQRQAATTFERIVVACFEQFGPRFFYKLDRERHPGWWYRGYCVDLLGLAGLVGLKQCLEYLQTQQLERFPDCGQKLPLNSVNAGVLKFQTKSKVVSNALWLQGIRGSMGDIKGAYMEYCAKKKRRAAKEDARARAKARARSPQSTPSATVNLPEGDRKPTREELRAAWRTDPMSARKTRRADSDDNDPMDQDD